MQQKVFDTFEEALSDLSDGASILIAGFGGVGSPANLMRALQLSGAKDLTLIANGAGGAGLVEEGRVRKVIASFTAATRPSRRSPVEELQQQGRIIAELTPQGTLAERIRCAGAGIPAVLFGPGGAGLHSVEEYVNLADVDVCRDVLVEAVRLISSSRP